jgi:hypothetical protein
MSRWYAIQSRYCGGGLPGAIAGAWALPGQGLVTKVEELKVNEVTTQKLEAFLAHARMLRKLADEACISVDEEERAYEGLEVRQASVGICPGIRGSLMLARLFMGKRIHSGHWDDQDGTGPRYPT